ncbi:MAG: hypothetical protein ACM3JB_11550 [Acidobacteriaceae bacterium]
MRCALLKVTAVLLLVLPAAAQMRSVISAGPVRAGHGHPGGIFTRPGFGRGFHHGNRFGTVIFPYSFGYYDDFYGERYPDVVEQPAPVVVVRDERQTTPPAPQVQIAPADPKLIDVPEIQIPRTGALARTPSAIFILADGRRLEAQNYTVTDTQLTLKEAYRPAVQIPLDQLNLQATLNENHQRGLDLQLPESRSEILLGF